MRLRISPDHGTERRLIQPAPEAAAQHPLIGVAAPGNDQYVADAAGLQCLQALQQMGVGRIMRQPVQIKAALENDTAIAHLAVAHSL